MKKSLVAKKCYLFLMAGLLVCSLFVRIIFFFEGCHYSYYPLVGSGMADILLEDNIWIHAILVVLLGVFLWLLEKRILCKLTEHAREKLCLAVLVVTAVVMTIVGTVFVHVNPYYPEGDQLNTTAGAYYCMQGEYSVLSPGGYVGLYQQQKGFMFLYEILFQIFGAFCYGVAKQFHVVFMILTLISGYGFIENLSNRPVYRIIFCMLMLFCMPFYIYLPYIYGDIPAICFTMVLFWALSAYRKKYQKRYIIIASLVAALALMCRMNTLIVLIAMAIGMILTAMERWDYRPLVAGLCVILVSVGTIKAVDVMYEYRSGYESGTGIPSILWIAMGLQETDGKAGVYNRYQQTVFEESHFDREDATQVGREYIEKRWKEFQNDPSMARNFFLEKMRSQWTEPLFEGLAATDSFQDGKELADWIHNLYYGSLHDIIWKLANYYQSFVYLALLLGIIGRLLRFKKESGNSIGWIPEITIIGGFLFSLIWENQNRYCLPYYIFMLVYVPEGIMQIGSCIDFLINRRSRKSSGWNNDEETKLRKVS